VAREFVPFDEEEIDFEFEALRKSSSFDAAKLDFCIGRLEDVEPNENPSPAVVWTFAEGFKELRHKSGSYKGRLLYYEPSEPHLAKQELVILRVFRKSTQKTPKAEINKAIRRMNSDIQRRKNEEGNK